MLLFIGGAARTGKGILVRRLLVDRQMPYLSLDVLKMGLARGVPEYDIDPDAGGIRVAERLWPLVREMSINLLEERMDCIFSINRGSHQETVQEAPRFNSLARSSMI
jgi:hypothetical protein